MTDCAHLRHAVSLKSFSQGASAAAVLVGCPALVGWALDVAGRTVSGVVQIDAPRHMKPCLVFVLYTELDHV
jgi:hypothetical protein